jgi:TetR/AcrR family transcriptional regulator
VKHLPQELPESKAGDILAAAERLFAQHNYDGVSMNAVAQEARVSKANVFHHFGSKEELYLAVLQNVRRELVEDLAGIRAEPGVDAGENLKRVGNLYLDHFIANADRVRLFIRENLEKRPGRGKDLAEKVFGKDYVALTTLLRDAQSRGELRQDVNPTMPMLMLVAACLFYFQTEEILKHLPSADETSDPHHFIRSVVDVLMHGIVAR